MHKSTTGKRSRAFGGSKKGRRARNANPNLLRLQFDTFLAQTDSSPCGWPKRRSTESRKIITEGDRDDGQNLNYWAPLNNRPV